MTYPGFDADVARATADYRVIGEVEWGGYCSYVEAVAGTGSRYVVIAVALPPLLRDSLGGAVLVTAYFPEKFSYVLTSEADMSYVAEKFYPGRALVNGGDLYALTRTINTALERITS